MQRRVSTASIAVALVSIAAIVLAGCAKTPGLGVAASPSLSRNVGAAGSAPDSGVDVKPEPGSSPGPGSAGGGATGTEPGAAARGAPGTTIPPQPSPHEFSETTALRDIHFAFDQHAIRPRDAYILGENAAWLKANPTVLLMIEGHCDDRGTNEYNLALGERRAKATRDHLVSLGVAAARITIISYGEERPVSASRTEASWAQNRRAHFLVRS